MAAILGPLVIRVWSEGVGIIIFYSMLMLDFRKGTHGSGPLFWCKKLKGCILKEWLETPRMSIFKSFIFPGILKHIYNIHTHTYIYINMIE